MTRSRWLRGVLAVTVGLALAGTARAGIDFQATLDTAQEVPAPTGTNPNAGGTATFTYDDETKMLTYTVMVHNLTATPVAAHLHQAAPGVSGGVVIPLDPAKTTDTKGPLTDAQTTALFQGLLYINFHTPQNPSGEIRGQVLLAPGACGCDAFSSHGQFVKCVRAEIKKLDKAKRKEASVKALKKAAAMSSCGRTKAAKKAVACCLPLTPEENIVTDSLCAPTKESKCAGAGGTSRGATSSCFPASPCSPSGAFLDEALF